MPWNRPFWRSTHCGLWTRAEEQRQILNSQFSILNYRTPFPSPLELVWKLRIENSKLRIEELR